jgi:hypothetical protein
MGAIDAGPAPTPPGESGETLTNVGASSPNLAGTAGQSAVVSVAAAAEYTRVGEEVIQVDGESWQSGSKSAVRIQGSPGDM